MVGAKTHARKTVAVFVAQPKKASVLIILQKNPPCIEYDDKHLFIEYNGQQHYKPVCFGGIPQEKAEEQFKKQQEHDKIKDDFCKENNHPLLWISYKDYGRINELVADFIIESTNWND